MSRSPPVGVADKSMVCGKYPKFKLVNVITLNITIDLTTCTTTTDGDWLYNYFKHMRKNYHVLPRYFFKYMHKNHHVLPQMSIYRLVPQRENEVHKTISEWREYWIWGLFPERQTKGFFVSLSDNVWVFPEMFPERQKLWLLSEFFRVHFSFHLWGLSGSRDSN